MGEWPLAVGGGGVESVGVTTFRGTQITAGAANVKGAWTQLTAATAREAHGIEVHLNTSGAVAEFLVDIGIDSATEEVLIPNIRFCGANQTNGVHYFFPIRIARGSRLTARCQSLGGAGGPRVSLKLFGPDFLYGAAPYARVEAIGADTTVSRGITVPGHATVVSTKGTETQLVAACVNPIKALAVAVGGGADITAAAAVEYALDILIGTAAGEIVIPDLLFVRDTGTDRPNPSFSGIYPVHAPAGTRVAAQLAANVTTVGDRDIDVVCYGIS